MTNKTSRPLVVPLPRGKTLHLGPGKTGQVATNAAGHPPLLELVRAGDVEIVDPGSASATAAGAGGGLAGSGRGAVSGRGGRRSGDR